MSTTQDQQDDTPAAEAAAQRPRWVVILGAVAIGIVLGGWQGAPRLAPRLAPCAEEAGSLWASLPRPFESAEVDADEGRADRIVQVDDLILNPAGTEGSRFLVLTLALEMRDEAGVQLVADRDPAVRDVVLALLATRTVPELSDVTARPALREELRDELNRLLGEGAVARIYLPRFVIQ